MCVNAKKMRINENQINIYRYINVKSLTMEMAIAKLHKNIKKKRKYALKWKTIRFQLASYAASGSCIQKPL